LIVIILHHQKENITTQKEDITTTTVDTYRYFVTSLKRIPASGGNGAILWQPAAQK